MWDQVQFVTAAVVVVVGALLGVALTLVTLPGTWVAIGIALLCWWWQPGLLTWWSVGAALGLAVLAEVAEFVSSAAGSKRAGGTRAGAVGSIVGALIGAVVGTPILPIVGTIVGAVVGAGLGAGIAERGVAQRTWGESWRSGQGAAVGRLASVAIKGVFAVLVALALCVDAVWN